MTPSERILYARIQERAAQMQPEAARRLLAAYDLLRDALTEAELVRALEQGTLERLLDEVLSDVRRDAPFARLRAFIDHAVLDGASLWARDLPGPLSFAVFDVLNPRVIEAVRALDTRVIEGLREEVRATIRQAAEAGLEAGQHPRTVARGIRQTLGLAPNQEQAVRNFRRMLVEGDAEALTRALRDRRFDGTLRKALSGKALTAEQVEHMAEAYRRRMLAFNAETHARTIALDAQRLAQRASWESAVANGIVDRGRVLRRWVTVGDDRVRPEHVAMNGETIPFDALYSNGERIPGESTYNCRCVERITLTREAA